MPSSGNAPDGTPPLAYAGAALFLDVDGTLLELVDVPSAVRMDGALRARLTELADALDGALALVSGRSLVDLDRISAPLTLPGAGQHGLEWRGPDGITHRRATAVLPDERRRELEDFVARHPGMLFEPKGASYALHFRARPELARQVTALVTDVAAAAGPSWEVLQGKEMVELRPAGVHKGHGIRALQALPPFTGRLPIFLGDDWTDEDGFAEVNARGGMSIAVGVDRETQAAYHLGSVAEVHDWLARSARALRRSKEPA